MLDEEHLLGAGREAGDRLCQFILEEDEIVAALIWCAAAWHLQDRDTMIPATGEKEDSEPSEARALLAIIPFDEK